MNVLKAMNEEKKTVNSFICLFSELPGDSQHKAGGKGGTLARLFQAGYPVPNGFIILPDAFEGNELLSVAWMEVQKELNRLRKKNNNIRFAIRSSAKAEDSSKASFAGEFETVLDVSTDDEVRSAIQAVRKSRLEERVKTYSEVKGIATAHDMAVVIQQLIQSDISGVLFTADPVTGNRMVMVGNFIQGYGEKLVAGESTGEEFTFQRPKGRYSGPESLKKFSKTLYKLAERVEKDFNFPQDIEWCISGKKLYLLQSRSVSTLAGYDPVKGLWNATLTGDYLWSNVNLAEATAEVMTPSTWSYNEILFNEADTTVTTGYGDSLFTGNICGRPYVNLSYLASSFGVIPGIDFMKSLGQYEDTMGRIPDIPRMPMLPFRLRTLIRNVPPNIKLELFGKQFIKNRYEYVATTPGKTREIIEKIGETSTTGELLSLWKNEIYPYYINSCWTLRFVMKSVVAPTSRLRNKLKKLVGEEDANALLSNLAGIEDQLASLGPVLGISRVIDGELSREDYLQRYGHRSPRETELLVPRPYEDPDWLDKQLNDYKQSNVDVKALLRRRHDEFNAAWEKFAEQYPKKVKKVLEEIKNVTQATIDREDVRSEYVRFCGCALRQFLLKVGQLTGLGDDIFFLTRGEIEILLSGDDSPFLAYIPARKETYEKYSSLPSYPAFIIGRFDPVEWASDPNRRTDIFDSQGTATASSDETELDVIKGSAGSMGRVEGRVRIIHSPDEGENLQPGEILVTETTNIGWTLLFPKASAIVTDVGAILSHAAIVARELGIPAVVGCSNATMRLKTGDRVLVDGGNGTVKILEAS
ncbi:MAG: PEP/pyruvate-binding domain-containing protein [Candidatus Odinarchaeota archaeon]